MVEVTKVPGTETRREQNHVIGWLLTNGERERLLERFEAKYERTIADHVTLRSGVPEGAPAPGPVEAEIVGEADDGAGVQALIVRIDGSTARPGGGTYHITWSLGATRMARESNDVIAERGWTAIDKPVPVKLEPGRFLGG